MSEKNDIFQDVRNALEKEKYPDDVFLYYGKISREGYNLLSSAIESRIAEGKKADKACLILVTLGGDPHAAFRIARALRHHYSHLDVLIPDICKSAGTIICIAANRLIFGDRGEIGPLDVQIPKTDEFFERMSGLDLIQALDDLRDQMLESFRESFLYIPGGTRLRTKIATELAKEFISPIMAQIDPVTLGQHQRALQIASDYGNRLNNMSQSMQPGALGMLVANYPDHGFVIDRKEAKKLFKKVDKPDADETMILLYEWVRAKLIPRKQLLYERSLYGSPLVGDLKQEKDRDETNQPGPKADAAEVKKEADQSG